MNKLLWRVLRFKKYIMKKKIAFVCVHNSCRSQIAEAFGKKYLSDFYECYSFGSERQENINKDAIRIMKNKYDIDMKSQYSKLFEDVGACDQYISMGCNVSCPIGFELSDNWQLDDPTGKSDEEFIKVIEQIKNNIIKLREDY